MIIYVMDYQGKNPHEIRKWLVENDAILVDGRRKRNAKEIHWKATYVTEIFGERYKHLPRLFTDRLVDMALVRSDCIIIYSFRRENQADIIVDLQSLGYDARPWPEEETPNQPIPADYLDSTQAREYLDFSEPTWSYHLHNSKHLQRYGQQVGRSWIFTRDQLDEFKRFLDQQL